MTQEAIDEQADINTKWHQFSKIYNATAEKVLGRKKRNNKPWISAKSWSIIEERKQLKSKMETAKSERIQQQLKSRY